MKRDGFLDQVLDLVLRVAHGDDAGKIGNICPHEVGLFSQMIVHVTFQMIALSLAGTIRTAASFSRGVH